MLDERRRDIIGEGPYYIRMQRNIENPNILYIVVVDKFGVAHASYEVFDETALYFELAIQHAYEGGKR